jgi:hypothetical protein
MFTKSVRQQIKIKVAITGISGGGKTYSALLMAKGMGGKVALIDTEASAASLYSDKFDFDICPIDPPYLTDKYIKAIDFAEKNGYETLIIDSISHQWSGAGGILERKTLADQRPGSNSYTNWGPFTKEHDSFVARILNAKINIITTMRSKAEYILAENSKGKMAPQKVGLAPIQRDNQEYEYSIVFDVAENHYTKVSKDRTGLFDGRIFIIDEKIGEEIKSFINGGVIIKKKTLREECLERIDLIKDEEKVFKIVPLVMEDDGSKLESYLVRINQIIEEQK